MNLGTLEEEAFNALVKQTVEEIKTKRGFKKRDKWISGEEVMTMLQIKSKAILQKLCDEGKIRFIQPERQIILYDADSIDRYFENTPKTYSDGNGR